MVLFYYPGFLEKVTRIVMGCDDAHVELECEYCMLVWEPLNSGLLIGLDNSVIETPVLEVGWMSITLSHYLSVIYIKLEAHFVPSLHHMELLL